MNPADLSLAWEEHQHTAGLIGQGLQHAVHHPWLDEFPRLERPAPTNINRVHAAFAADHRRVVEQPGQALALQGCGHQQNFQRRIVAQQLPAIETQRQGQVGIQATLVKLIEDQQPYALQRRVCLQPAGQDAFGDHFDTGIGPDLAVQANAVTHRFTDFLAQLAGQPFCRRTRRQPARLQHHDGLPGQPGFIQQCQRYTGSLACAGRRLEHRFVTVFQGMAQSRQGSIDW